MDKKSSSGPNLSARALIFHGEPRHLKHRSNDCQGLVVQKVARRKGVYQQDKVIGRPYCRECLRLVGRKAWRRIESRLLQAGRPIPKEGDWAYWETDIGSGAAGTRFMFRCFYETEKKRKALPMDPHPEPELAGLPDALPRGDLEFLLGPGSELSFTIEAMIAAPTSDQSKVCLFSSPTHWAIAAEGPEEVLLPKILYDRNAAKFFAAHMCTLAKKHTYQDFANLVSNCATYYRVHKRGPSVFSKWLVLGRHFLLYPQIEATLL